ncbi:MAG: D-alanine--D-alanine ligase [Prevotellaceae bacterium]|jgi:D-alanine-D-alanine ligase|nr:D-alanine--D-alanine ligase [Prevotellaceae bacterium]
MKKNIGIFFGGRSVEHEISVISALQVIKMIDRERYEAIPVYLAKDGSWYTGNWLKYIDNFRNGRELIRHCRKIIPSLTARDGTLLGCPQGWLKRSRVVAKIDVAFPVFHGAYGEDGCMQGVFEIMDIPYAGSDVTASAVGMNKILTKEICKAAGIPVLEHYRLDADGWFADRENHIARITRQFTFPVIVKPNNLGSSIGASKAGNAAELENAIELAAVYTDDILVEKYVTAIKEINCSVMATAAGVEVSECEEPLIAPNKLLSFDDKYLSGNASPKGMAGSSRKIPADIPDAVKKEIRDCAAGIFNRLGCSGVARIDFIMDTATKKVYLNEINTIPGSMAFYLWEATGKNFTTLITETIEHAVKRFTRNSKLMKSFDSGVLFNIDGNKLSGKLL